jgi:hypothetical protein
LIALNVLNGKIAIVEMIIHPGVRQKSDFHINSDKIPKG